MQELTPPFNRQPTPLKARNSRVTSRVPVSLIANHNYPYGRGCGVGCPLGVGVGLGVAVAHGPGTNTPTSSTSVLVRSPKPSSCTRNLTPMVWPTHGVRSTL